MDHKMIEDKVPQLVYVALIVFLILIEDDV